MTDGQAMSGAGDRSRRALGIAAYASQFGMTETEVEAYFSETFGTDFAEEAFNATGGRAWHGAALTRRERSLVTVAILATLGGVESRLTGHVRWALAHGATPEDLSAAMILVANYAGFARASVAMEIVAAEAGEHGDAGGRA